MQSHKGSAAGESSITLTVQRGPSPGRRFTLSKTTAVLGRQGNCDVKIQSQQVSPRHAQITAESGQHVIRDLASDYGTTVNGIPVRGPYPLRDGDVIGLGEVQIGFAAGDGEQTTSFWYTPSGYTEQSGATEAGLPSELAAEGRPRWPMFLGGGCVIALVLVCCVALVVFIGLGPVRSMAAAPEVKVYQPATGQQVQSGQPLVIIANARDPKASLAASFMSMAFWPPRFRVLSRRASP